MYPWVDGGCGGGGGVLLGGGACEGGVVEEKGKGVMCRCCFLYCGKYI